MGDYKQQLHIALNYRLLRLIFLFLLLELFYNAYFSFISLYISRHLISICAENKMSSKTVICINATNIYKYMAEL